MRLLVDTCAALFLWDGDSRLPERVQDALSDPANELILHQVSFLEIVIKHSLGKLKLPERPSVLVPEALNAYGMGYAPLTNDDIRGLEDLPFHHRDPFDRLLISHARLHGLVLVTPDEQARLYGVPLLW